MEFLVDGEAKVGDRVFLFKLSLLEEDFWDGLPPKVSPQMFRRCSGNISYLISLTEATSANSHSGAQVTQLPLVQDVFFASSSQEGSSAFGGQKFWSSKTQTTT